jgi:hypothetical protein
MTGLGSDVEAEYCRAAARYARQLDLLIINSFAKILSPQKSRGGPRGTNHRLAQIMRGASC